MTDGEDDLEKRLEKLEVKIDWNRERVVLGDPHVLEHLMQLERRVKRLEASLTPLDEGNDDLEEHRKRIRKIIDEDRELLDALAGVDTEENDDE